MKKNNFNLKLNAIGRFSMSNWTNNNISVGNKSENSKLANWIELKEFGIKNTRKFLINQFNKKEIKKMSILDVGCADGYLIENLSQLGFKKNVGIEPRKSSITRGKNIRKVLNIRERAVYYPLSIEQLNKKFSFDIVTCFGVLHHTSNIYKNLEKLLLSSKKLLILEGEFIPEELYKNKKFFNQGQLKDLLYDKKFTKNKYLKIKYGITLHKYESAYYDGLTNITGIVDIPSIDSLRMYADTLGYESKVLIKKQFKNKLNSFRAILIFKKVKTKKLSELEIYEKYEEKNISTVLPMKILKIYDSLEEYRELKINFSNSHKFIVQNLKFNFKDKMNLEFSKYYIFKKKDFVTGKSYLNKIIYKRNVDWFSCYRAFYLLYLIDLKKKNFWKRLLISCHPTFPVKLLNKKFTFFS